MRGPIRVVLLDLVTADETTSDPIDVQGCPYITFYLQGDANTISSGSITYEESTDDPDHSNQPYGGTWSIIGTAVNATDVNGGKQKATRATVGAYHRVRARVDTAIGGGGKITVVLVATPSS